MLLIRIRRRWGEIMECKNDYEENRLRSSTQILENKPFTAYPSDALGYSTPEGSVMITNKELREYPYLKIVHKLYKPRYRYYGRYTVFASNDKKHWFRVIDHNINKP